MQRNYVQEILGADNSNDTHEASSVGKTEK